MKPAMKSMKTLVIPLRQSSMEILTRSSKPILGKKAGRTLKHSATVGVALKTAPGRMTTQGKDGTNQLQRAGNQALQINRDISNQIMQAASRNKVQRTMQTDTHGGNFVLHAMKNNRVMLINHVKQKAQDNTYPVNLCNLDRKEFELDRCFRDGKLLENMKLHGYQQYHKKNFETMKIENTEKMRN